MIQEIRNRNYLLKVLNFKNKKIENVYQKNGIIINTYLMILSKKKIDTLIISKFLYNY